VDEPPEPHIPGRAELRLVARAIREEWPIPPEARPELVNEALRAMRGASALLDGRTLIASMRVILAANAQNLQGEALELQREKLARETDAGGAATVADAMTLVERLEKVMGGIA
jgi:hypothetical protein